MSDAGFNTRIEELAEAIENLAIGISASAMHKVNPEQAASKEVQQFMKDARTEIRQKLRGFMIPSLRVVEPRQPYNEAVPIMDRVICGFCKKDHICSQPNCKQWHDSVKAKVAAVVSGDDKPPDAAA